MIDRVWMEMSEDAMLQIDDVSHMSLDKEQYDVIVAEYRELHPGEDVNLPILQDFFGLKIVISPTRQRGLEFLRCASA